jgi:hypothetical protein
MKSIALLAIFSASVFSSVAQYKTDSLITVLRGEIEQKEAYVKRKIERIGSVMEMAPAPSGSLDEWFKHYNSLYHLYKTFIYDSAFNYATKLLATSYRIGNPSRIGYARVKLGFILISSGMFKETFDSLNVVDVSSLTDTTRVDYYRLMARAYSDLSIYNNDQYYKGYYDKLVTVYMDSALQLCQPRSYNYFYLSAVKNLHSKKFTEATNSVHELLKTHSTLSYPQFAVNYNDLGNAYGFLNEDDRAIQYAILSSLSDIRAATKETAAMFALAKRLYKKGDTENAYVFIKQAADDANFYGARQRKVEIGSLLPVIASAALSNSESGRMLWLRYGIGLSVLSIVTVVFSFIIYSQVKKLKAAESKINEANRVLQDTNTKLTEANKIKEEYIGYYVSMSSEYVDKIDALKMSVTQKLINKKYEDIRFIINNLDAKRDREELYFSFDKVFLKLFPDFVKTFNSYLKPEEQFILKDGQLLNTELRIFALIRMGITDTENIARVLNYSVNTIYAYKTKVRNKSILPNDVFDQKIMEIKAM